MLVEVAVDDVLCGSDDEITDLRIKLFERDVGFRSGLLEDSKRTDDAQRHGVMTDVKIQQRASGLATKVPVGGDLEFTHGVGLNAHVSFSGLCSTRFTA